MRLARTRTIEVEETLLGRLLGYGTLIAGELEVDYVADPWRAWQAAGGSEEEPRERRRQRRPPPRAQRGDLAAAGGGRSGRHGRV